MKPSVADVPPGQTCLACGTPIIGPYCHACGQRHDDCRRAIGSLAFEVVRDTAALDGRFMRTCRSALMRPGAHIRDYAHGKRSPFTPPVRFFFVVLFVFFATLWAMDRNIFLLQLIPEARDGDEVYSEVVEEAERGPGVYFEMDNDPPSDGDDGSGPGFQFTFDREFGEDDDTDAPPEEPPLPPDTPAPPAEADVGDEAAADGEDASALAAETALERMIELGIQPDGMSSDELKDELEGLRGELGDETVDALIERTEKKNKRPKITPYVGVFLKARDLTYTEEEKQWVRDSFGFEGDTEINGKVLSSERLTEALILTMQNPAAFNNALNEAIPILLLVFVPFMAVLGTIFIRGRDALVYDHLLLSVQTHSFAFVLMILALLTIEWVDGDIALLFFLIGVPTYYAISAKGAFDRSWRKTIVATFFVGFWYNLFFLIGLSIAVLLSFIEIS